MPTSGKFLLDTNIVIALFEGEERVLSSLDAASEVFIPATVMGELFFGAAKSGRSGDNTVKLERFATEASILPIDLDVAREYGRLRHGLRAIGAANSRKRHLDCRHGDSSWTRPCHSRPALPRS